MGVNGVTGDYSRGASGFWIENGQRDLSGERGDDRRQSHRDVRRARCRRTISNSATAPMRRPSAWRDSPLPDADRAGRCRCRRDLGAMPCARPARLRSTIFRVPMRQWTKGKVVAVSEADIAVDRLLRERLGKCDSGRMAGCPRRPRTIWRGSTRKRSGSSIRSTARALISPASRTGRSPWRSSPTAVRSSRRCLRR